MQGIVAERRYGGIEFVYDIGPATIWMKAEVARTCSRFGLAPRCCVRRQLAGAGIELVDHDLVETQIGDVQITICMVQLHAVRVRPGLPIWIHARSLMLRDRNRRTQLTI